MGFREEAAKRASSGTGGGGELPQWDAPKPKNWNEAIQEMYAPDVQPNPSPTAKALSFLVHLDEPTELFVGYQNAMNYVLLAGPYPTAFAAKARYPEIWKRFDADSSLDTIFPHDKRDIALLAFFDVPAATKRKGAYGKV